MLSHNIHLKKKKKFSYTSQSLFVFENLIDKEKVCVSHGIHSFVDFSF